MARHESGNYSSELFDKNLNAFGMGVPSKRRFLGQPSALIVEGQPMAKYNSIEQSAADLLELFKFNRFPTDLKSVTQFAGELKADGYYTDSVENYTRALKRFLPREKWSIASAPVRAQNIIAPVRDIDSVPRKEMENIFSTPAPPVNIFSSNPTLSSPDCERL